MHNNDLYYQSHPSAKESVRITHDENVDVLNGLADWIYEEEILGVPQALWWSKDGE